MSCNYLYIDDEEQDRVQQYVDALQKHDELKITRIQPIEFSKLIKEILETEVDGILIDWKLDERIQEDVVYKAGEVAQSLRSRSIENEEYAKPIILISTDEKLEKTYSLDETSHDLFDHVYTKGGVVDAGVQVAQELIYFTDSYSALKKYKKEKKEIIEILGLEDEKNLDSRIKGNLLTKDETLKPVHECARFIINDLLQIPGLLIDEYVLKARLGLNNEEEEENWESFKKEELNKFKYVGPFSSIWPRWWAPKLEVWWAERIEVKKPLQLLDAGQRVQLINQNLNKKFTPAQPIDESYSKEFWTICQDLKRPLDSIDGFMIESKKSFPWQEEQYICKKSAAERTYKQHGIRIHQMEEERLMDFLSGDE